MAAAILPRSSVGSSTNRAQSLSSSILSATSPSQMASSLSSLLSFLSSSDHAHNPRPFFSLALPSLILRLFGFDSSPSWLSLAASDASLSQRLLSLLSPDGPLLSSPPSALRFLFPLERLPAWIRFALNSPDLSPLLPDLCPLLRSRIKDAAHIQLNCFEYYLFWFAYYPVSTATNNNNNSNTTSTTTATTTKNKRFRLEQWTSNLPSIVSSKKPGHQTGHCDLYLRLLYSYLKAFVPRSGSGVYQQQQPYRSSLLHYPSTYDCSEEYLRAEFLVYALVHFWLVDNDFSPLPVSACRSLGVSFEKLKSANGEMPPTPGLGEVVNLLVKYLNCGNGGVVFTESPVKKGGSGSVSCETCVGSWNLVMQRPLYRFILRSFLFCPMGTSVKNASQVFSVWVAYMTPWKSGPQDFAELESPMGQRLGSSSRENEMKSNDDRKVQRKEDLVYTPAWESYVAANYLFYSSLVVHFLGFAHKFLHMNVDAVVQMVLKVLDILTSSPELLNFLRRVDAAYHSRQSGSFSSYVDNIYKYVPSIREQLQDWEDGLCESDADGSFLHEKWNHGPRLLSDREDGVPKLLQLFVLRAQHEIQMVNGDAQNVDSIRSKMGILFGGPSSTSYTPTPTEEPLNLQQDREVFTPKHPGVGKMTWADVNYRGDWMRRPTSDSEVAWLARLLISLSCWLNVTLGLDRVDNTHSTGPAYVDVPHDDAVDVGGPKEAVVMVLSLVVSWLRLLFQSVVNFMRGRGIRINLRVLASKKFVMVLVVYAVACALKKVFYYVAALSL